MRSEENALIKSQWDHLGEVKLTLVKNQGKKLLFNGIAIEKYSDWIGRLPVVILSPEDAVLTTGTPQVKRLYFDRLFSQVSHDYLSVLIKYSRLLKQKNAYLKRKNEGKDFKYDIQLETYDEQLAPLSRELFSFRARHFEILNKHLITFFRGIDARDVTPVIEYKSSVQTPKKEDYVSAYMRECKENIQNEILMKRSLRGAGYDRIEFKRSGESLKTGASQGEKKFWLICLKLAEGHYIKAFKHEEPLYLFDDLLSELDIEHSKNLLEHIGELKEIIITSTDLSDLRRHGIPMSPGSFNIIDI